MDDFDDDQVASDFLSIVGDAQLNELIEVERRRDAEREAMKRLVEEQQSSAMTLMQIAGMRTQKELNALALEKNEAEEKRSRDEEIKRKEIENARLVNQFPPPDLRHS